MRRGGKPESRRARRSESQKARKPESRKAGELFGGVTGIVPDCGRRTLAEERIS